MRLYGKRSVAERLKSNPHSIKTIIIQEGIDRSDIINLARANNISIEKFTRKRFEQISRNIQTQGVIAETSGFLYHDYDEIIDRPDPEKYTLIILDRVTDPHNLGVILRSSACFGKFCLVLPKFEAVEINETVLKVACGAENYIPVCLVTNLSVAIQKAKKAGYWIAATVVNDGDNPRQVKLNSPLAVLFGSEGQGIRPGLMKYVDYKLTLPMKGAHLSFNVAMAVGIFCYEISSQIG
jgi:23S rRNA (guanosine2251-2'-O)-methyltransferase